jgi:hypothetical protein
MITLDLSILNQKGTPMFNSDIFANRPTFGIPGRIFISTDTLEIYRDTGSSWTLLSGGGGGTISGTIATGQVAFGTAANTIGGTNNLYWDNASTFLGINTNAPNNNLVVNTIVSDGGILLKQNNTSIGELIRVGTNNYSKLLLINAGVNNIDLNSGGFSYIRQNNFAIGSNTDTGEKFQVVGSSLLNGDVTFSSSIGMFWNATTSRLGLGTATPNGIYSGNNKSIQILAPANFTSELVLSRPVGAFGATSVTHFLSGTGVDIFGIYTTSTTLSYSISTNATERLRIFSTGNVTIKAGNNPTDTGQSLQVQGEAFIKGSGSDSTTNALSIQNSSSTILYRFRNDGSLRFGAETVLLSPTGNGTSTSTAGRGLLLQTAIGSASGVGEFSVTGSINSISSNTWTFAATSNFIPTSGSATYIGILFQSTINQTGGANGITRGLYVNPTLTAAADFRAIEWNNNSTWGLYGAGTAPSYFAGNVQIGSTTAIGSTINLQVTGLAHILDTRTYTSGTIQSFVVQKNTTINSAISSSSGICNYVSTGDNGISSSQSVPASTSFANIYAFNKYQFNSAGLTLTQTQGSPGVRSISQLFTQNVFKGANNGTITHMSGIQIGGYYNDNTGTITPVITNAYQLLINDTGAYGHTFTLTNRWGIYQEGINDRNYLAGNLMLNSTTDTGQILQVNGAIRVNGQASGSAGGSSGNHLIINVDGTSYKIALLNP